MDLEILQEALSAANLDGWLLYDFRGSNPIARRIVGLAPERHTTRRWFYFIPRKGAPTAVVHAVESRSLGNLPGTAAVYRSYRDLESVLGRCLKDKHRIAMEYSPGGALPYVGRVDAGTIEMARALGPDIVSSADLVQIFEARWTKDQKDLHDRAAEGVLAAKNAAFDLVRMRLKGKASISESEVQKFIIEEFGRRRLAFDHPPIVAVNEHASNPHFETCPGERDRPIRRGDLLLVDLWAKLAEPPEAVYYDTTWMAFCGDEAPERMRAAWEAVRDARDAAIAFVQSAATSRRAIRGCDVDDVARSVIEQRGYGDYFIHRTGHSIGTEVHGNGVNIDNFETRDERRIIPGLCFSIEPGVYLPEFGVRSEIDLYFGEDAAEVTGAIQKDLLFLA
ncbi:MAG: aminopeptidase P family protein [Vicinamibacteria bacterium]|nr:aminopeptidase P family protein [Vicinamibacteria bacterium]